MPEEVIDEVEPEPGSRVFRSMLPPDYPAFEEAMKMDVYDIVATYQMHSEKHTLTCFKYASKRKCRFRFLRILVNHTVFDDETGVILQRRDHEWLNNYNPWFSLIMRSNHDCQYLFTQIHTLAIIYYIIKYISKAELNTYSKLTIAAAVSKSLTTSRGKMDPGKTMLLRTYNELSSHREVGIPEALSHLLDYPNTLTSGVFNNLHTTYLLNYRKSHQELALVGESSDASIIRVGNKMAVVALFDDYAHRGPHLADMCLYLYCSLIYKIKRSGGIPFDADHPQHITHRQFVRTEKSAIPTLLEKLLFLRPDSDDETVRDEYFCLVSGLFVPWSHDQPLQKLSDASWEDFFLVQEPHLTPVLQQYIDNLATLHKSKEEVEIDQMQLRAQCGEDRDSNRDNMDGFFCADRQEDWEDDGTDMTRSLALVQSSLEGSLNSLDKYIREAMDANQTNGYFERPVESVSSDFRETSFNSYEPSDGPVFEVVDPKLVAKLLRDVRMNIVDTADAGGGDVQPCVFLSDSDVSSLIRHFTLNKDQSRAFRIVYNHTLGRYPRDEPQLLMGVFGERGTGKSRLIEAIRVWFHRNHCQKELIVTATTGNAAVKINGFTVHSAVSIPIKKSDSIRMGKLTPKQLGEWSERQYMIIDEVSMLDCKVMEHLHTQPGVAKAKPEIEFGDVNIIFFGDFLQLPAVVNPNLYVDNKNWGLGHRLWRSLNAVVILKEQMRQSEDLHSAALLSRLQIRTLTDQEIKILKSRIGVELPNMQSVPVVVHRHNVWHAINTRKIQKVESNSNTRIVYCIADVADVKNMSKYQAYQIRFGERGSPLDAILPLFPGVPFMITQNVNRDLGTHTLSDFADFYRLSEWKNCKFLWICRFRWQEIIWTYRITFRIYVGESIRKHH